MIIYSIFGLILLHLILFQLGLKVGGNSYDSSNWRKRLGQKLMDTKKIQLQKNPLLKRFAQLMEQEKTVKGQLLLALLIWLKSLGMVLIGLVGLTLLLVPVQGVMMACLLRNASDSGLDGKTMVSVMLIQLIAQLLLGAWGNRIGWALFMDGGMASLEGTGMMTWALFSLVLSIVLITLTAAMEARFYQANQRLISG